MGGVRLLGTQEQVRTKFPSNSTYSIQINLDFKFHLKKTTYILGAYFQNKVFLW